LFASLDAVQRRKSARVAMDIGVYPAETDKDHTIVLRGDCLFFRGASVKVKNMVFRMHRLFLHIGSALQIPWELSPGETTFLQ
tara:strand:+ start:5975 stop:6223 length:249 start_codon:yes stop_codon:yes gene_type:complete